MSDESVFGLIAQQAAAQQKGKMYRSHHNPNIPPSFSTFGFQGTSKVIGNIAGDTADADAGPHPSKKATGTFGKTAAESIDPKHFLKKHTADHASTQLGYTPAAFKRDHVKPPVPSREDKPVMGLKTDKNFVVSNAVENILAVPKKQEKAETRHTDKSTYGKVPQYIDKRREELRTQHELVDAAARAHSVEQRSRMQQMSPEEAAELKAALRKRWADVNRDFQTLGFQIETRSQLKRKELLEAELKAIEAGIAKIDRALIFVYDDNQ